MNRSRLITPYRMVRHHLKEYFTRPPENAKELFNLRPASLCNAIERTFGVLKKRFPSIASTTKLSYCVDIQNEIILSCCIFHNYLVGIDLDESLIVEVDEEVLHSHHGRTAPTVRDLKSSASQKKGFLECFLGHLSFLVSDVESSLIFFIQKNKKKNTNYKIHD